MAGGAKIFFADSNSDGQLRDMEVARMHRHGQRRPLDQGILLALQVAQNPKPQSLRAGSLELLRRLRKPSMSSANTDKVKLMTYDPPEAVIKDYGFGDASDLRARIASIQYAFAFKERRVEGRQDRSHRPSPAIARKHAVPSETIAAPGGASS